MRCVAMFLEEVHCWQFMCLWTTNSRVCWQRQTLTTLNTTGFTVTLDRSTCWWDNDCCVFVCVEYRHVDEAKVTDTPTSAQSSAPHTFVYVCMQPWPAPAAHGNGSGYQWWSHRASAVIQSISKSASSYHQSPTNRFFLEAPTDWRWRTLRIGMGGCNCLGWNRLKQHNFLKFSTELGGKVHIFYCLTLISRRNLHALLKYQRKSQGYFTL